ncbi:MAG: Rne/Rng family ribonuclease [Clostridia bacterium]|nr:Rne/Rng family ribonuclease [Clostridia bacterium]
MSGRRIFIDCLSPCYRAALTDDGILTELIFQNKDDEVCVGDIYAGRIEKILPSGIGFVNIGHKTPVFLQMNEKGENTQGAKQGQDILVQITKEAFDNKRAVCTTRISRAGKYCVLVKDNGGIGISAKITDEDARERLRKLADDKNKEGYSIVIRTGALNASESEVKEEIDSLAYEISKIEERGKYTKAPAIIYKETDPIGKILRDMGSEEYSVVVNDSSIIENEYFKNANVEVYTGNVPLFVNYGIERQIEKLFNKRVWLKSGGYIVIDETEAMNVIDVNSGKSVNVKDSLKINIEAAREAARQIRLRNLNGMIIIDFISGKSKEQNEILSRVLKEEFLKDRVKTYIVGMTELGLMQITREKHRKPLSRYIYHKCPLCGGAGYVKDNVYMDLT